MACSLNHHPTTALWDTGAQVSLVSQDWLNKNLPRVSGRPLAEILEGEPLKLSAANGGIIPYSGWVEVGLQVPGEGSSTDPIIQVPLLITPEPLEHPILGYNIIETLIHGQGKPNTLAQLTRLLPHAKKSAVNQLATLLEDREDDEICQVYTCRTNVKVVAGETRLVKCRRPNGMVDQTTVLFDPMEPKCLPEGLTPSCSPVDIRGGRNLTFTVPISNDTNHDIVLPGRTHLGRLIPMRAILPAELLQESQIKVSSLTKVHEPNPPEGKPQKEPWVPPVDLEHLTPAQCQLAKEMLTEEADAFARDEQDLGCITSLQMHL